MWQLCSEHNIRYVWESKHVHIFVFVYSHKHLHFLDADGNKQDTEESTHAHVCVCRRAYAHVAWTYIWMFACTCANRWMFYCWRLFHSCFHFTAVVKIVADKPFFNFVFTDASMWSTKSTFGAWNLMLTNCRWFIVTTWCDVIHCTH